MDFNIQGYDGNKAISIKDTREATQPSVFGTFSGAVFALGKAILIRAIRAPLVSLYTMATTKFAKTDVFARVPNPVLLKIMSTETFTIEEDYETEALENTETNAQDTINSETEAKALEVIDSETEAKALDVIDSETEVKAEDTIDSDTETKAEDTINSDTIDNDTETKAEGTIDSDTEKSPIRTITTPKRKNTKGKKQSKAKSKISRQQFGAFPATADSTGYNVFDLPSDLSDLLRPTKTRKPKKTTSASAALGSAAGRSVPYEDKVKLPTLGLAQESWAKAIEDYDHGRIPSIPVARGQRTYTVDISAEMTRNLKGERDNDHHLSLNVLQAVLNAKIPGIVTKTKKNQNKNIEVLCKVQRPDQQRPTIFKFIFIAEGWHAQQQVRLITAYRVSTETVVKNLGGNVVGQFTVDKWETIKIEHEEEFLNAS
ncbi:MAG: hypothetical protein Q8K75_08600 [Chlamydiales bacterium]|nr:hypothetical protein [Chlamydiales bacterium]